MKSLANLVAEHTSETFALFLEEIKRLEKPPTMNVKRTRIAPEEFRMGVQTTVRVILINQYEFHT